MRAIDLMAAITLSSPMEQLQMGISRDDFLSRYFEREYLAGLLTILLEADARTHSRQ
jgi:hypothetical protein